MSKSATEVVQDALFSAIIDAVTAMKTNSGGSPHMLMRDINGLHSNATFDDLPEHVQKSIRESVKATLNRLRKDGYSVTPSSMAPARQVRAKQVTVRR